jgi:hypothetical protein
MLGEHVLKEEAVSDAAAKNRVRESLKQNLRRKLKLRKNS